MISENTLECLLVINRFKLQFKGRRISVGGYDDEGFQERSS